MMRVLFYAVLVSTSLGLTENTSAQNPEAKFIIGTLMNSKEIPNSSLIVSGLNNGDPIVNAGTGTVIGGPGPAAFPAIPFSSGDRFIFTESNLVDPNGVNRENQNQHQFRFSEDGINPLLLDGDLPWTVSMDITISTPFPEPRKSLLFQLAGSNGSNSGGPNSNFNLTTSATPITQANGGANLAPGESGVFGGQFDRQRVIGLCDTASVCDDDRDLNPYMEGPPVSGVGYFAGTEVSIRVEHVPSPDDGETPAQVLYSYDDGSVDAPYTNTLTNFRNNDPTHGFAFVDDYEIGFLIAGHAELGFGTDSYTVDMRNLVINLGAVTESADFDEDLDVDGADFLAWQRGHGMMGIAELGDGDANDDMNVDGDDLAIWQSQFGSSSGEMLTGVVGVPEPGSTVLLVLGVLGLTGRGRNSRQLWSRR